MLLFGVLITNISTLNTVLLTAGCLPYLFRGFFSTLLRRFKGFAEDFFIFAAAYYISCWRVVVSCSKVVLALFPDGPVALHDNLAAAPQLCDCLHACPPMLLSCQPAKQRNVLQSMVSHKRDVENAPAGSRRPLLNYPGSG